MRSPISALQPDRPRKHQGEWKRSARASGLVLRTLMARSAQVARWPTTLRWPPGLTMSPVVWEHHDHISSLRTRPCGSGDAPCERRRRVGAQALTSSEQVRGRLRPLRQVRTRTGQQGVTGAPVGDSASTGGVVASTLNPTASTNLSQFMPGVEAVEAVEANPTTLRG